MWKKTERCGKYELLEKLASGGMADIYLARTVSTDGFNKFVVIKRILPQFSQENTIVKMFREEAKVAMALKNNNIVSIFDFGLENKQYFLVMDYIEGTTLKQFCLELKKENIRLSVAQVLFIVKEVASGLIHVHQAINPNNGNSLNLIHRDISPQNIMISFTGEVKIIDFGIAKITGTETTDTKKDMSTLRGKFMYVSPEQVECIKLDARSDIFSLGIILWELLANDQLFSGKTEINILQNVLNCSVPPIKDINPAVPGALVQIIKKALTKNRDLRYQTAVEFCRDLNNLLNLNYPEYSQQEFSIFVNQLFKSQSDDLRDKLIKYSQTPYIESPKELPEGFSANSSENIRPQDEMNFGKLLESSLIPESQKIRRLEKDFYSKSIQHNIVNNIGKIVPMRKLKISNGILERFFKLSLWALALSLTIYSFNKFIYPKARAIILAAISTQTAPKVNFYEEPVVFNTKKIVIPNKDLSEISNKIKVAYVNIILAKENSKVRLSINGKLLAEKPPLYMYPIAAEKKITLTAFDPSTNKTLKLNLNVGVGKIADALLDFKQ